MRTQSRSLLAGALAAGAIMLTQAVPAYAQSSSVTITAGAGALTFTPAPGNIDFGSVVSSGSPQTPTTTQAYDVSDTTATGTGWNVSVAAANLTSGGNTIPAANASVTSLTVAPTCDAPSSCTVADNSGTTYAVPMSNTLPVKIVRAAASTGMGTQHFTAGWSLVVPGGVIAGSYTATWTITLNSGP